MRAAGLGASALWYDEAFALRLARLSPVGLVAAGAADFNPTLAELLAWPFVHVLGGSALALRLPSLLASIVALFLTLQLIEHYCLNNWQGLLATAGAALMPYQFWMAQDGRMYALMSALYLGGALFAIHQRWLGLAACAGLLMYCHNTGVFYAAALFVFAWLRRPDWWQQILLAGGVASAAFLPWIPRELASSGGTFWLGPFDAGVMMLGLMRVFFADTLTLPFAALGVMVVTASLALAAGVSLWLAMVKRGLGWLALPALASGTRGDIR